MKNEKYVQQIFKVLTFHEQGGTLKSKITGKEVTI
jgi:hypothetical protein